MIIKINYNVNDLWRELEKKNSLIKQFIDLGNIFSLSLAVIDLPTRVFLSHESRQYPCIELIIHKRWRFYNKNS